MKGRVLSALLHHEERFAFCELDVTCGRGAVDPKACEGRVEFDFLSRLKRVMVCLWLAAVEINWVLFFGYST